MNQSDGCFLGVDGGGTKTAFVLIDRAGRELARHEGGSSYHVEIGVERLHVVLHDGVQSVLKQAGASADDVLFAFFGLPAHGEDSQIQPVLDVIPEALLGHRRYACGNDMICGWAGSLGGEDGINIVAGTGSIGYGQRAGRAARAGGWGEAFSDEGSAYWIAMQALNTYSRMSDGRLPKGSLHALINETLGLRADLDLCAHVYGADARTRGELAQLSLLVSKAAAQGDSAALDIFRRAGQELAQIADAIRRQLGYDTGEKVRLSYSGGAFAAGDLLLKPFHAALLASFAGFELCRPQHEPHFGAALYAARLATAAS